MTETSDNTDSLMRQENSDLFDACMRRGNDLLAIEAWPEAQRQFDQAHLLNPASPQALFKLGGAHFQQNQDIRAIEALSAASRLDPNDVEILNTLGAAYGRAGRIKEAVAAFQQAIQLDPNHSAVALNCGRLLFSSGSFLEAEAWLTKAASLRPGRAKILRLLAEARLALGQPRLAVTAGEQAVQADPDNAEAHLVLGQAYLSIRKLEAAHHHLTHFLSRTPDHPEGLYYLAETEEKRGHTEIARHLYARVLTLDIDSAFRTLTRLKGTLTLPVINESVTSILEARERIKTALVTLPREPVADPYSSGGFTNFFLAYQGQNDKELQQHIAEFYLDCCPSLAAVAPHISNPPTRTKWRVAILSSFLRNHTVGYLCRGLIEHLDRDRFEVVLLRSPLLPIEDPVAPSLAALADQVIDLPDDYIKAQSMVAAVAADLIYFPEIGMEDLVYFLAFARSAPVQVMGWGHPVTSGIPNMDAFLSVAAMEPANAADHYSEELIELEGLSLCVTPPIPSDSSCTRNTFGMEMDAPAYLCAQSLFKIHPDFDAIAAALLEKDPAALLYFLAIDTHTDEIFLNRLKQHVGANIGRVKILPRIESKNFPALLGCADVLLDIPHWAGGKTSLESLFTGTPIVHWPGTYMRGRHTLAFYKRMDVMDCVVDSAEAYIETAYRLVHDIAFRASVRERIAARAPLLFNDTSAITEISDVFERLIRNSR
jgi:protein O-GlcNAc transferase